MKEAMLSVFILSAVLSVIAAFRSGGVSERAERTALTLILMAALLRPVGTLLEAVPELWSPPSVSLPSEDDPLYAAQAQAAFCEGIRMAVCREFSLGDTDVRVTVDGFSFEAMTAERVTVYLSGGGCLADHKAVAAYIEKGGFGVCHVVREA